MSDRNQLLAQIIAAMGGGSTPDGTPILEAANQYTNEQIEAAKIQLNQDIQATSSRFVGTYETLDDLIAANPERSIVAGAWGTVDPVGQAPTTYFWSTTDLEWTTSAVDKQVLGTRARKFAILPLAGQSNAQGFGESPYDLTKENSYNPRIFQLGRYATGATTSDFEVSQADFNYGVDQELMRPYADCNLHIIPAAPCLDNTQNLWVFQQGGFAGFAFNTAKAWLKYLPDEYDIIIVPCARGGSRINPSGSVAGTYDAVNKRASQNATFWGAVDAPLYLDFKNRVQHCLDLSEDTLLLPVIWAQGEFDAGSKAIHKAGFETIFDDFFNFISTNYANRLVDGDINNFRWMCLSSTKWMWNLNTELDWRDMSADYSATQDGAASYERPEPYDNYVELSQEKLNNAGVPFIHYVRIDITHDGRFVQTNREKGNGISSSSRQLHFSTYGNTVQIPQILAAAVTSVGGLPLIDNLKQWTRYDRCGVSSTINTNNHVAISPVLGYSAPDPADLALYLDFGEATTAIDAEFIKDGHTLALVGNGAPLIEDPVMGKVARFDGGGWIQYTIPAIAASSFTRHIVFKQTEESKDTRTGCNLISGVGSSGLGVMWTNNGSISAYTNYSTRAKIMRWNPCHIMTEPHNIGGWTAATLVYESNSGTAVLYINGKRVQKLEGVNGWITSLNIGNYNNVEVSTNLTFVGDIASVRVYDAALSASEVSAIVYNDLYSHFE